METKEIIAEIQSKTQFVISMTVFFLAVLQNFYKTLGSDAKASDMFLKYSLVVVFYLFFYLIFEWRKNEVNFAWLNKIRISIIAGIGFLALQILTIATSVNNNSDVSWPIITLYVVSLWGSFILPIVLMLGMSLGLVIEECRKLKA